jgi:hypothetical protein
MRQSVDGAAIVGKHSEVTVQLLDLVLLAAVAVLVRKTKELVTFPLAILLGLLGLVQTGHDDTSSGRNCPLCGTHGRTSIGLS